MVKPNLTLRTIQLNIWAADNFTTPDILFLSVVAMTDVISLTSLKITMPLAFCKNGTLFLP